MSRVFFERELEGLATFWRVFRRDGVVVALTGHDRDLWFDGLWHLASPGILPSAIRKSASLAADSAEVQGALAHSSISAADLATGRFDNARVEIGLVDWETTERAVLHRGKIGDVTEEAGRFEADLRSAKAELENDVVPRLSPTCRAVFCGPGCTLSAARFTHEGRVAAIDLEANAIVFAGVTDLWRIANGTVRWLDGPHAGLQMEVSEALDDSLVVDMALDDALRPGARALLREGCDRTLATCAARFANSVNFQGEPFLPGNDLLARYPVVPT